MRESEDNDVNDSSRTLTARDISVSFDGVRALHNAHVTVETTKITGLIGPNGAGKTTLVNVISGYQRPSTGSVHIGADDATLWRAARRARGGVVRTFQAVRPFEDLSVRENVEIAALGVGASTKVAGERGDSLLAELRLADVADVQAGALPYGDQRRLAIARALAAQPTFLLLDEPAAGMSEEESEVLGDLLLEIRDEFGVGMLLIEHDMTLVMRVSDNISVLNFGEILAHGTPDEVRADPAVVEAYLGA